MHDDDPGDRAAVPTGHASHDDDPTWLKVPTAHDLHTDEPIVSVYVPAGLV